MAVLAATGLDNVAPATLNLVGDDALYVNTDYFKIVHFKLGDAVTEWNLSAASTGGWLVQLKKRPSDPDADAVATGSYVNGDSTPANGLICFKFAATALLPADAGDLYFSAALTSTAGSYRIPVLQGMARLEETALLVAP